jgi:predicted cupin superfamily sugar epimerase
MGLLIAIFVSATFPARHCEARSNLFRAGRRLAHQDRLTITVIYYLATSNTTMLIHYHRNRYHLLYPFQRKKKRNLTQTILTDAQKQLLTQHIGYYNRLIRYR